MQVNVYHGGRVKAYSDNYIQFEKNFFQFLSTIKGMVSDLTLDIQSRKAEEAFQQLIAEENKLAQRCRSRFERFWFRFQPTTQLSFLEQYGCRYQPQSYSPQSDTIVFAAELLTLESLALDENGNLSNPPYTKEQIQQVFNWPSQSSIPKTKDLLDFPARTFTNIE